VDWDLKEECIRNKSNEMLNVTMADEDGLYWEADAVEVIPAKRKKIKVDKESVTDLVSTVKTAISSVKTRQTNSQQQKPMEAMPPAKNTTTQDAQTVVSQVLTITQLTEQVSILQLAHNKINSKLNKLAKFIMAQSATNKSPSPSQRKAAGGLRGSPGDNPRVPSAAGNVHSSFMTGKAHNLNTNPPRNLSQAWMGRIPIQGHRKTDGDILWDTNNPIPSE